MQLSPNFNIMKNKILKSTQEFVQKWYEESEWIETNGEEHLTREDYKQTAVAAVKILTQILQDSQRRNGKPV